MLELPGEQAAREVAAYWAAVEERTAQQRALAAHLRDRLSGRRPTMYDGIIREVGEQTFLTERRHLLVADLPAWIGSTLDRLEAVARECGGIAGSPFVRYYAEVSDESDGPAEACVPVADPAAERYAAAHRRTVALGHEPAHREAYTRLVQAQVAHPQIDSAFDAVERWTADKGLTVTGPCREVYL